MCSKKKNKDMELTRRDLLTYASGATLGLGKMSLLTKVLLDGVFEEALAQTTVYSKKKYVYMAQYQAPPRWTFDLILTPDGDMSKFVKNNHVGTKYTGGTRYTGVEYATSLVNGIQMPWMWRFTIPTSNGGFAPMGNLMDGMMVLRGVDTKNPAHPAAHAAHMRPNGILHSLPTLTADQSAAPLAAVNLNVPSYTFTSSKGLSATSLSNRGNTLKELLDPFAKVTNSAYDSNQDRVRAVIEASENSLDSLAIKDKAINETIQKNTEAAIDLFGKNYGNLDTIFNQLSNKYKTLIRRALDTSRPLEGISDKPIGTTGTRDLKYTLNGSTPASNPDLRDIIANSTTLDPMAERFAVAEFLLVNNLSSSISMRLEPFRGLAATGSGGERQNFDEHRVGAMTSLLCNTFYNMALSSCLLEFITVLKDNNIYDDTVIDLCGEFGRVPRTNGTGSDHSPTANCNTFFSGSIKDTQIIGNIRQGSTTYGQGGNNPGVGLLGMGHFVSTLSSLLEVESQITAVSSLVKLENGKFVSALPKPKIV